MMSINSLFSLFSLKKDSLTSIMKSFQSPSGNFSIDYPVLLQAGDMPDGSHGDLEVIAEISNILSSPKIEISKRLFPSGKVEDVWDWGRKRAQAYSDFQGLGNKPYITSNYMGFVQEYMRSLENIWGKQEFHCLDWYYLNNTNNIGYDFSFCTDQQYWNVAENAFYNMINSIKFNP